MGPKKPVLDNYRTLEARLESFKKWPIAETAKASGKRLAEAGVYRISTKQPGSRNTTCFSCQKCLEGWESDDDPIAEHKRGTENRCRYLERQDLKFRLSTFKDNWPHPVGGTWKATPETLAECGFYWFGDEAELDLTECVCCGYNLGGWEPDDDPVALHFAKKPYCPYAIAAHQRATNTIKLEAEKKPEKSIPAKAAKAPAAKPGVKRRNAPRKSVKPKAKAEPEEEDKEDEKENESMSDAEPIKPLPPPPQKKPKLQQKTPQGPVQCLSVDDLYDSESAEKVPVPEIAREADTPTLEMNLAKNPARKMNIKAQAKTPAQVRESNGKSVQKPENVDDTETDEQSNKENELPTEAAHTEGVKEKREILKERNVDEGVGAGEVGEQVSWEKEREERAQCEGWDHVDRFCGMKMHEDDREWVEFAIQQTKVFAARMRAIAVSKNFDVATGYPFAEKILSRYEKGEMGLMDPLPLEVQPLPNTIQIDGRGCKSMEDVYQSRKFWEKAIMVGENDCERRRIKLRDWVNGVVNKQQSLASQQEPKRNEEVNKPPTEKQAKKSLGRAVAPRPKKRAAARKR
eukprot:comp20886_c0_seq1/m.27748 comp20886_c0_seq1/g.27748  ORF comp20886_c0_seq1/g.27748 comp20886_c0_seq1/m.27748 type:complete len:574 (-) comp20886_c0_seq1:138-1859(-)